MANELLVGQHRVGNLIDGNPDTPRLDVVLRRDENGIILDVPWNPDSQAYESWFRARRTLGGLSLSAEPAGASSPMPTSLVFTDSHGRVLLVGCRSAGYTTNQSSGLGRVHADYAVFGVRDTSYEKINRLRWEVSGLRRWMGMSSIREWDDPDARRRTNITIEPGMAFGVPGRTDFTLVPRTWWRQVSDDVHEAHDLLWIETISEEPSRWGTHASVPRKLRDLISLSRWSTETIELRSASREDDVIRVPRTQEVLGLDWHEVITSPQEHTERPTDYEPFVRELISFDDIGLAGLPTWFSLSDEYARVIDPIVSQTIVREAHPFARLSHTGPAVEALGYFLLLEDGVSERRAAQMPLKERLERIAQDLREVLPFDVEAWVDSMPVVYNGLKHANRAAPDTIDVLNAWGRSILVVRAWVALRLGIPASELKDRLSRDRQGYDFVEIEQA